jgi:hypothetical protein
MATLNSPGVAVTVIDESFYTPAAPGTTPLLIVTSAESKQNGSSTGTAPGTLKANAGQVYLMTSQKDLSDTFGTPIFKTDANNNPIHAGEQNEYGLQAAYSYLGVSNRAYVVRADIDLSQLDARSSAPAGKPADGTYWFDTASTKFGIFEWNSASGTVTGGQAFTVKYPTVITDITRVVGDEIFAPRASIGSIGSYAMVSVTTLNKLWYKKALTNTPAGSWVEVGTSEWKAAWPTAQGTTATITIINADTFIINGTTVTDAANLTALVLAINTAAIEGITAAAINGKIELYSTGVDIVLTGTAPTKVGLVVSTYRAPSLVMAPHTQIPSFKRTDDLTTANGVATGAIWVKTTSPNLGADWVVNKYSENTGAFTEQLAPLYPTGAAALAGRDSTGGGINLALGALYVKFNDDEGTPALANFKIYARRGVGATTIKSVPVAALTFTSGSTSFTIQESVTGSSTLSESVEITFTASGTADDAETLLDAFTAAFTSSNMVASKNANNQITFSHVQGGDFRLVDGTGTPVAKLFSTTTTANFYADPSISEDDYIASLWTSTVGGNAFAPASSDAPTTIAVDGQLWYNSIIDEVDIMVHNGTDWVGYANLDQAHGEGTPTDTAGPIVSASKPTVQSDGTALANGDIWVSTADLENFPMIYKFNYTTKKWVLVDNGDQSTENGILFRDARWNTTGMTADASSISELLMSNFIDFDAPDPALYPKGMLLWNLRRSGFNVKRFAIDYIDVLARNVRFGFSEDSSVGEQMKDYYPNRWLSEAANQENGAGTFGRKAQRKVVQQALQALVNSNQQIRDEESRVFNLLACPGYPELIGELVSLNFDRGLTAFIVGDTPARLTPDATSLSNWGNNQAGALEDNDTGLVSSDEYLGLFYPWGFTSDNLGNNVVVPPSHMMLRTIALSDNVSYPWFAPAGTRRGGITNATAVGYITSEGEFASVALNNGQRDTLASIKVNPLTFITGTGLVNYGQYTRARNASALDRINVARLVIFLRRQFAQLAKPYVFEPNDKITRDEIKGAANSLLLELVGQRALYDYLVVCDESNNTPARIDRSELYLDVAIEPVKAVEFIYIPLRLKNTGEIKGLGA